MIFALLPFIAIAVVAFYLARWRADVRRRNAQSWESLVARLRPDSSAHELSDQFLWKEGLKTTPEETWKRIQGPHGLWAMYQNSRVMLEMADYAARNSDSVNNTLLANLRSDAMQIRVCVLMALVQYAFSQVNEGICGNAFRAASMYAGWRTDNAAPASECCGPPSDFVAAM